MNFLTQIAIRIPVVILALTVREIAKGYTAYAFGDMSAKHDGRLSLNLMNHIDPIGLLCIILFRFGWGKGRSVDPRHLKNPRKDMAFIALAGPMSNFVLAFISMLILYPAVAIGSNNIFIQLIIILARESIILNLSFAVFTLIPIPPLDGFTILSGFLPIQFYINVVRFSRYGFIIVLILVYTGVIGIILSPIILSLISGLQEIVSIIYFFL